MQINRISSHLYGLERDPADSPREAPTVLLAGPLTAMDAPGGGEVQMVSLGRALRGLGVDARLWRPWEDRLAGADCLHLFGSVPEHLGVVEAAHRRNVPVVLSTIAWFNAACYWREPLPLTRKAAGCMGLAARRLLPSIPSWRRRLYHAVDLLLPNSQAEADQLVHYFGVPRERIHLVPNGADERFVHGDAEAFEGAAGVRDFVLYAGRIEPRKNQLGFLEAMRAAEFPVVVLGDVVPGHEGYLAECCRAATDRVRFIRRLDHDGPLLAGAYAACACVALTSWYETPGLVALEAGMSGVPLVLPRGGSAREYFGDHAVYVRPDDRRAIQHGVLAAVACGRSPALAEHVRANFSWSAAARATREAYRTVSNSFAPEGRTRRKAA